MQKNDLIKNVLAAVMLLAGASAATSCQGLIDAVIGDVDKPTTVTPSTPVAPTSENLPMIETPLTFEAVTGTINLTFKSTLKDAVALEYSTDGGISWNTVSVPSGTPEYYDGESHEEVPGTLNTTDAEKIMVRATNATYGESDWNISSSEVIRHCSISACDDCYVYGNVMSLINATDFKTLTAFDATKGEYAFYGLFKNNSHIKNHTEKELVLPAATLTKGCYNSMFSGCDKLTSTPVLSATMMAESCYFNMFRNCVSLTVVPELPSTTMAKDCYGLMFSGCTSLTKAPELPATTLAENCYSSMFSDCTGLTSAPTLPATTLANSCYNGMFMRCTGLTTASDLPATVLAEYCYQNMFRGCTSLAAAPALPATTMADFCYTRMFDGCSSLTSAPALPATILAKRCYSYMFRDCTSLNSVTCLATDISAEDCTTNWLRGVASTGTFTKTASMTSWTTGSNGIPSGWTTKDYTE